MYWYDCLPFSISCISSFLVFLHTLCRLYSCLANGSPDEFQRGEQLYRVRAVKDPLQIGEKLHTLHAVKLTAFDTIGYEPLKTFCINLFASLLGAVAI